MGEWVNPKRRTVLLLVVVVAAGLSSMLAMSDATHTIIVGDPAAYRERTEAILAGGVPYVDVPLEHLPMTLVPMVAAWFLGGSGSQSDYVFVYAALQVIALAGTLVAVGALGRSLGCPKASSRWLAATLPLVPLVTFRNDPFVTLLFVLAAVALSEGHRGWVPLGVAGALAKVWPAGLALWAVKIGSRAGSVLVAGSGVLAVVWTLHPGFTAARQGFGIHAETLMGSLVGLLRTVSGAESGVELTTAAYLPADTWVLLVNAAIGVGIAVAGVLAIRAANCNRSSFLALGTVVIGVILASQLFSLQYLLWLTPFVAISKQRLTLIAAVFGGLLTIGLAWYWNPSAFELPALYGLFSLRNAAVICLAWWLRDEAVATSTASRPETSDATLPG